MKAKSKHVKYGVLILVPLVISMLFISMNAFINASQTDELSPSAATPSSQIWLELKAAGNPVEGDGQVTGFARENMIRVYTFRHDVVVPIGSDGKATGNRQHQPIVVTKRIDKASPLLYKALTNSESITGTFHYFRTNPSDGSTEEYFNIYIENGLVTSLREFSFTDDQGSTLQMEEVSFVYQTITWTHLIDGTEHVDSWEQQS